MEDNFEEEINNDNKHIIYTVILSIVGIILCVLAFIPYKKDINCKGTDSDVACKFSNAVCSVDGSHCYIKKKRYYLIVPGIFLLCLAGLIFFYK